MKKNRSIVFAIITLIFIAAINTTCKKKELKCDEIIVVGGITGELIGPEWLVLRINEILANTHERGFTPAIMVYSGTYDGSEYIFIESLMYIWEAYTCRGVFIPFDTSKDSFFTKLYRTYGQVLEWCRREMLWMSFIWEFCDW